MFKTKSIGTFAVAALVSCTLMQSARAAILITEVAPWSSGSSSLAADWFEVTNTGPSAVNVSTWRMDDNSNSIGSSVPLSGISSIAAGEAVIYIETTGGDANAFKTLWFGANPPAGLQIGSYGGSGVGLSTSGDAVNLYSNTSALGGTLQANVVFGASPSGPFPTFGNTAGLNNATISQLSAVGTNGAFAAANDANEVGSPGVGVPEPASIGLMSLVMIGALSRRRRNA